MLAAIGVRESQFVEDKVQAGGGWGRGAYQIDLKEQGWKVTEAQAKNLLWATDWAAKTLAANNAVLAAAHPNLDPAHLVQATAASRNLGTGGITGNPDTIDKGSPKDNYGTNIVNLMDCFH